MSYGKYMAMVKDGDTQPFSAEYEEPDPNAIPCRYCGKLFVPYHGGVKYCSSKCRRGMENRQKREYHTRKKLSGGYTERDDMALCGICGK